MNAYLTLALGVLCAAGGGELFVRGTVGIAHWLRVSPAIIGATVAALATSSPELAVAVSSALAFLRREAPYAAAPHPDLVLLTIYVAARNGLEVLAEMKQDPRLKRIPVVMWSISAQQHDVDRSYELGANAYVRKPVSLAEHCAIVKVLFEFWCRDVLLPSTA